jgi:hypothetical protein
LKAFMYALRIDHLPSAPGSNFITAMSDALDRCDRVVALFSAAYFDRPRYTTEEWSVAALHVLGTGDNRLVPVRVEEVPVADMPAVLRPLVFRDLFEASEEQARQALLEAVAGPQRRGAFRRPPLSSASFPAVRWLPAFWWLRNCRCGVCR